MYTNVEKFFGGKNEIQYQLENVAMNDVLRVPVLAGHHRVVALGKLLAPVCLCDQAV